MFITIIAGICLYIFSVYILKMYRRKKEQFDLMSTCGTTGGRCSEDNPYCLITERTLPTNDLDQTIVFNTYGRYVKVFPPATQGDGYVFLSSLEIFDSTGTNVLKGKAVSSPSRSDTTNSSQQAKLVGDNGGKIRYYPNIFITPTNDKNTAAWEVDLGQVYMITKIRYIGRGDKGDAREVNILRNIGVRIRIYKNQTDVPTTGTCVAKPAIIYPIGTKEEEKSILEPIILAGMNGVVALKVYNGIKTSPGTLLTSYGLTDEQAAAAYVQMASANNRMAATGWNIVGTWDANTYEISVISGAMPIVDQTIFSTDPVSVYKTFKDGETTPTYSSTDTKGTPEKIYPITSGAKVTKVNGRKITIDTIIGVAGNNIGITLNAYKSDKWLSNQYILYQKVKKMSDLSYLNKEDTIVLYKKHNVSNVNSFSTDAGGNLIINENNINGDDGLKATLHTIMSVTMPVTVDPSAGNSMNLHTLSDTEKQDGYTTTMITPPTDTTKSYSDALSKADTPDPTMKNPKAVKKQYSINDQFNLTGENTFTSTQTDLVDAYTLAMEIAGAAAESVRNIGPGRTQRKELMVLGNSMSFSDKASTQAACEEIGGTLATAQEVRDDYNKSNKWVAGNEAFVKRPQWHEWGWVSDSDSKFLVTQQKSLMLPIKNTVWTYDPVTNGGTYGDGVTDIPRVGGVIEDSSISTGGAICKAIKTSTIPITKAVTGNGNIEQVSMKSSGRYVRIWPPLISFTPATDSKCSDSSYTLAAWSNNKICVNNTNDRIMLSQVVIKNKDGTNIGLGRGSHVKTLYGGESGTFRGDPNLKQDPKRLVDGSEQVLGYHAGVWVSKKYLACPRNMFNDSDFSNTYQTRNLCQEELYWQIDLGTSQYIESVTLYGCSGAYCNPIKGLRVEVSKSLRPRPYNNDPNKWGWNDITAFTPPCPISLIPKVCVDYTDKMPYLACVFDKDGLRNCPGDCDPGSYWCALKCKCIIDLNELKAWESMEIKGIDTTDMAGKTPEEYAPIYDAKVVTAKTKAQTNWTDFTNAMTTAEQVTSNFDTAITPPHFGDCDYFCQKEGPDSDGCKKKVWNGTATDCFGSKDYIDGACYDKCPSGLWHLYLAPWFCVNANHYCTARDGELQMVHTRSEQKSWTHKTSKQRYYGCPEGTEMTTVSKKATYCPNYGSCSDKTYSREACTAKYKNETCCTPGTGCQGTSLCTTSTTESINSFYNKQIDYSQYVLGQAPLPSPLIPSPLIPSPPCPIQ